MAWTARSYARVAGANERISIGVIGCGRRGFGAHMPGVHAHAESQNIEITAVADPWRPRREEASAKANEWYGRPARMFVSYRDLLELDDIDAVMIASCDHQHTTHLDAAANAKKDAYCEKPLAMDVDRLRKAYDAVKASGIVCQIGTQVRSWPTSRGCRELFKSGVLGRISRVEQCRNSTQPYWYAHLREARKEDVDWNEFLMHVPTRPFNVDQFTGWYGYRDFTGGPVPGFGSHFIDLMNYIVGTTCPTSSVAQGGTFTWKDEHKFTCPDHVQATWIYPEGFMVSYTSNLGHGDGNTFRIYGEHGVIDLTQWTKPMVYGKGAIEKGKLGEPVAVEPVEGPDHFLDWLQCLRTRGTPNASIEAGYQHAVAVIMAMQACDTGRRQVYDHEKREIHPG
jgi:predicted dehydrogenase